jgi:hypothetical protein
VFIVQRRSYIADITLCHNTQNSKKTEVSRLLNNTKLVHEDAEYGYGANKAYQKEEDRKQ